MPKTTTHLPNDYERMIPEYHKGGQVYGEHVGRYEAVKNIVENKIVLDIACGSGYGTAILSNSAAHVTGVDVSSESVDYAKERYNRKNINYVCGEGTQIPCKDNTFDVIISFETIEHIEKYNEFLIECRRVLKKGGLLIISTPNDLEFAEGNHFHIHQFKYVELIKLLKTRFSSTKSFFQATWISSLIGEEEEMNKEWRGQIDFIQAAPIPIEKVLYFYILCSDRPINERIKPLNVLGEHWSERKNVERESNHIKTRDRIKVLENDVKDYKVELSEIKNSKSFKIVRKIGNIKRAITGHFQ